MNHGGGGGRCQVWKKSRSNRFLNLLTLGGLTDLFAFDKFPVLNVF